MITDSGVYRLLAWLSPAFPVGAFTYSHALEAAVEEGLVADRDGLIRWVRLALEHGAGRTDATLFVATWRAARAGDAAGFAWAAEWAAAMRGTSELALESLAPGVAFLETVRAAWPELAWPHWLERRGVPIAYPVAAALVAALAEIPLGPSLTAYLQAFAANVVSAGVRLIPLGQTDGQRAVAALEPTVAACVAAAPARPLEDLGAAAPLVDLLSMRHETQYTRLFRS